MLLLRVATFAAKPLHGSEFCEPPPFATKGPSSLLAVPVAAEAQLQVAVCITGLAVHGDFKYKYPLTHPKTYRPLAAWLHQLRVYGLNISTFVHVDLHSGDPGVTRQSVTRCGGPPGPTVPLSSLQPMINALQPTAFEAANRAGTRCFCKEHEELCRVAHVLPRWWEQADKWAGAARMVVQHEHKHGIRFDFVAVLRADYQPIVSHVFGASANVTVRAIRLLQPSGQHGGAAEPRRVFFQPWYGSCFGQLDWFFLGRRADVLRLLLISRMNGSWVRCVEERYARRGRYDTNTGEVAAPDSAPGAGHATGRIGHAAGASPPRAPAPTCMLRNEYVLAEWTIDHGVAFSALPIASNGLAVCNSHRWGLVDRSHPSETFVAPSCLAAADAERLVTDLEVKVAAEVGTEITHQEQAGGGGRRAHLGGLGGSSSGSHSRSHSGLGVTST